MRGSAICEFKVADIEKTFDESPQMMLTGNEEEGYVWKLRDLVGRPPAKVREASTVLCLSVFPLPFSLHSKILEIFDNGYVVVGSE